MKVVTDVVNERLKSLAQKLLNELFVLAVAGAELVNLGVKPVLARAELVDSDTKLSNNRPKLIIAR